MLNNKKVKIFYNGKNKGIAYTKHRCIELAKGKYCGFLDPDDRLTPDALEKVVAIFEKGLPSVSLVYSNFYVCRDTMAKCYTAPIYDIPVKLNLLVGLKPDAFSAFRKRSYFETTGIDQKLEKAIDRDLVLKLEEQGDTIKIDDCLYYYRFHEKATSNYQNAFKAEYWAWKPPARWHGAARTSRFWKATNGSCRGSSAAGPRPSWSTTSHPWASSCARTRKRSS